MTNLKDLAKVVSAYLPQDEFGGRFWSYASSFDDNSFSPLPESLEVTVEELVNRLRATIPDDIDFTLCIGDRGTTLALEYNDGPMSGTFEGGTKFDTDDEMFAALAETDWEEYRSNALQQTAIFDPLIEDAAKRPINIPSSEEAARKWEEKLKKQLVKAHNLKPTPAFVAIMRDQTGKFDVTSYRDKGHMLGDFADALTCQYQILAVLQNGEEVIYPQIESYKRQAIDLLGVGTISRAKAEGRFFF